MNAYVLHDVNKIQLENVAKPIPEKNEVLVQVKAVGICGSDIPRIYQTGAHVHPLIPGHEFAGVVVETGPGVSPTWTGKRVGVFPLIPCHSCITCQKQQYEMCRNYSYLGSRRDGAFAEYVTVPEENLIELPETVSLKEAAMLEPMAVAVHAMRHMSLTGNESVAVCGLGTIGLLLLMFLKEAGVQNIYVIGNKKFQREKVLAMGIAPEHYCDSKAEDTGVWLSEQTNGRGVDVFFECVGKKETFEQSISGTAPGGRIQLVGNPYSDMDLEKNVYWKILRNQLTIKGSWNSSFTHETSDDWHYVLERLEQKRICPADFISHELSFGELERGLHIMRDKTEDYVKIIMKADE